MPIDLSDPALLVAFALGALTVVVCMRLLQRPSTAPRCPNCDLPMEREEEIVDAENPELRYIEGRRQAWFGCGQCGTRRRAGY